MTMILGTILRIIHGIWSIMQKKQEILNRIMQRITSIVTSALINIHSHVNDKLVTTDDIIQFSLVIRIYKNAQSSSTGSSTAYGSQQALSCSKQIHWLYNVCTEHCEQQHYGQTHANTYICTCTNEYTCTHTCTHIATCTCMYIICICMCVHVCTCACVYLILGLCQL